MKKGKNDYIIIMKTTGKENYIKKKKREREKDFHLELNSTSGKNLYFALDGISTTN